MALYVLITILQGRSAPKRSRFGLCSRICGWSKNHGGHGGLSYPSRPAGGGIHPHPARDRGRVPQTGAAVLDREGFLGPAAPAAEGVPPRQAAAAAAAR